MEWGRLFFCMILGFAHPSVILRRMTRIAKMLQLHGSHARISVKTICRAKSRVSCCSSGKQPEDAIAVVRHRRVTRNADYFFLSGMTASPMHSHFPLRSTPGIDPAERATELFPVLVFALFRRCADHRCQAWPIDVDLHAVVG